MPTYALDYPMLDQMSLADLKQSMPATGGALPATGGTLETLGLKTGGNKRASEGESTDAPEPKAMPKALRKAPMNAYDCTRATPLDDRRVPERREKRKPPTPDGGGMHPPACTGPVGTVPASLGTVPEDEPADGYLPATGVIAAGAMAERNYLRWAALDEPADGDPSSSSSSHPPRASLQQTAIPQVTDDDLEEIGAVPYYRNRQGFVVNAMNERIDPLGRLTRPRGCKGKHSSRRYKERGWYEG